MKTQNPYKPLNYTEPEKKQNRIMNLILVVAMILSIVIACTSCRTVQKCKLSDKAIYRCISENTITINKDSYKIAEV